MTQILNQRKRSFERATKLCEYINEKYNKWYKVCEYCGEIYDNEMQTLNPANKFMPADFEHEDFCCEECKYRYNKEN